MIPPWNRSFLQLTVQPVRVAASKIAGYGLFATEDIKPNTFICGATIAAAMSMVLLTHKQTMSVK